jgi:hypothetical protein
MIRKIDVPAEAMVELKRRRDHNNRIDNLQDQNVDTTVIPEVSDSVKNQLRKDFKKDMQGYAIFCRHII